MNIQSWLPLGLTGMIFLLSKGLSRVFSRTAVLKHQFFNTQPSFWSNSHIQTWLLEKPLLGLYGPLLAKWCLCFLMHCLGLSQTSLQGVSFNSMAVVTVCSDCGAQEYKNVSLFPLFPHVCGMQYWDWMPWSSFFKCWVLSQFFYSPFSSSSRGSLVAVHFVPFEWPSLVKSFIIYRCHLPYIPCIPIYAFLLASAHRGRCVPCPPKTSACTVLQISSHLLRVSSIILPSFSTHIHSANIYRATLYLDAGVIMANELDIVSYELDLIKLPL